VNILRFLLPKSSVEYISEGDSIRQAYEKMKYHRYVAIPVLSESGEYIGSVRRDDIYKYFIDSGRVDFRSAERESVMSMLDPGYAKPLRQDATVQDLVEGVMEHNYVPVVDDRNCFIGIILRRSVLSFLFNHYEKTRNG
jgi:CBS-domain-containing membrane protein